MIWFFVVDFPQASVNVHARVMVTVPSALVTGVSSYVTF